MKGRIERVLMDILVKLKEGKLDECLLNCNSPKHDLDIHEASLMELEEHSFHEVAISITGTNIIQIEDSYYRIDRGQVCLVEKGVRHSCGWYNDASMPSEMLWIAIAGNVIRAGCSGYGPKAHQKIWGADLKAPGDFFIDEILSEIKNNTVSGREAASIYLSTLIVVILRKLSLESKAKDSNWGLQLSNEIKDYILKNLDSHLRLKELSEIVSVSPAYLCKVFRKIEGENISSFIKRSKILRAAEILSSSQTPLSEIAEKLDYYDQFHLSKTFKYYFSISPSAYRSLSSNEQLTKISEINPEEEGDDMD